MHATAINLRGGVSPRNTRLRGQSIIEYVLIIAVIGLVIVFAGPGVPGAIRNQFNLVGNTVNSGATGGTEGGGTSGGGSTGADSATIQAAIAKDAKDWTLGEQKAVAEDIAKNGTASPAYTKAKAAMDAGTEFSMKLTNGQDADLPHHRHRPRRPCGWLRQGGADVPHHLEGYLVPYECDEHQRRRLGEVGAP